MGRRNCAGAERRGPERRHHCADHCGGAALPGRPLLCRGQVAQSQQVRAPRRRRARRRHANGHAGRHEPRVGLGVRGKVKTKPKSVYAKKKKKKKKKKGFLKKKKKKKKKK